MSTIEPDEGTQADDQRADAPRWEKIEAASAPGAPRWERADRDAESSDSDGPGADDASTDS